MEITLNVKKAAVYNEVAKLTGYVGAKTVGDTGLTYDRVFTTEDDKEMLERYWRDACADSTGEFKQFIKTVSSPANSQTVDDTEVYSAVMNMPAAFDVNLTTAIESALFSYFVNKITSQWFAISNKEEVEYYRKEAEKNGNEVRRNIYFRRKPVRVIPV